MVALRLLLAQTWTRSFTLPSPAALGFPFPIPRGTLEAVPVPPAARCSPLALPPSQGPRAVTGTGEPGTRGLAVRGWAGEMEQLSKAPGRGAPKPARAMQHAAPRQNGDASWLTSAFCLLASAGLRSRDMRRLQLEELVPDSERRHRGAGRTAAPGQIPPQQSTTSPSAETPFPPAREWACFALKINVSN